MILLPRPPSTNSLYFNRKGGRTKTPAYAAWCEEAGWMLKTQRPEPVEGKVEVEIRVEKRGKVKEDIDNRIKAVLDALVSAGVIGDDRAVWRVTAEWADIKDCQVEVIPYGETIRL
jgi:crossover junction endodeoxyribonuclease RusA